MSNLLRIIASFSCLYSAEAMASEPHLYQVTGVALDDTLNVRSKPSGSSQDIGDLSATGTVEIIEISPDGRWGRLVWQEANGWVSMRFLRKAERENPVPVGLLCSGTEPFWSLEVNPAGGVNFDRLGFDQVREVAKFTNATGRIGAPYGFLSQNLVGIVSAHTCTDGMSDREYGWTFSLMSKGETPTLYEGCCMMSLAN